MTMFYRFEWPWCSDFTALLRTCEKDSSLDGGIFFVDRNFYKGVHNFLISHVMSELPYEECSIN